MQQLFTCIQCTLDGNFTARGICNKDICCDIVLVTDMIKNSVHLYLRCSQSLPSAPAPHSGSNHLFSPLDPSTTATPAFPRTVSTSPALTSRCIAPGTTLTLFTVKTSVASTLPTYPHIEEPLESLGKIQRTGLYNSLSVDIASRCV